MAKPKQPKAPPPTPEQKQLRRKDHTIVPSAPYLLTSKFLDLACGAPVIHNMCPTAGWRSAIGEAGVFPTGKLSHSYESYFGEDINADVAFEDFMQTTAAVDVSTLNGVDQLQGTLTNYYKFARRVPCGVLVKIVNSR